MTLFQGRVTVHCLGPLSSRCVVGVSVVGPGSLG